ncbi:hypothetical protein KVH07_14760 [Streptomyces olivaceus]|uniref:hypothetical protein n=1 Tax=Streptomyces olivaceus TaxID=47716 RepID=UPI0008790B11|nr:hypothetical protein [Streptomyces olivaceus]AOW88087.1 hypothetical protein BC342_17835 [Streptomyces olivaceus]MBZ6194178.1 hypothetical protein [Streptomyces olivaceus]
MFRRPLPVSPPAAAGAVDRRVGSGPVVPRDECLYNIDVDDVSLPEDEDEDEEEDERNRQRVG